jgi:hypothetical protein
LVQAALLIVGEDPSTAKYTETTLVKKDDHSLVEPIFWF